FQSRRIYTIHLERRIPPPVLAGAAAPTVRRNDGMRKGKGTCISRRLLKPHASMLFYYSASHRRSPVSELRQWLRRSLQSTLSTHSAARTGSSPWQRSLS